MARLECVQTLSGHVDRVWNVSWSPSGDTLASCSGDRTIRLWQRASPSSSQWTCVATLEGAHTRTVRRASWSPDGRALASASFDRTVVVWRRSSSDGEWAAAAVLEGHESEVKAVSWRGDGEMLATCGRDKTVWVWAAEAGGDYEVVDVKHGHAQDVKTVVWHPDGRALVSASYDDTLKVWVEADGEWACGQTLLGHASTVWDASFDRQGKRLASCSDDATIRIWLCKNDRDGEPDWQLAQVLQGQDARTIFSVDWSPADLLASCSADDAVRVFGPGQGPDSSLVLVACAEKAHPTDVNCVRWSPAEADLLASAGDDGTVRLWRLVQ